MITKEQINIGDVYIKREKDNNFSNVVCNAELSEGVYSFSYLMGRGSYVWRHGDPFELTLNEAQDCIKELSIHASEEEDINDN